MGKDLRALDMSSMDTWREVRKVSEETEGVCLRVLG